MKAEAVKASAKPVVRDDRSAGIEKKKVVTPKFRVSFPAIFKPKAFDTSQEAKYSLTMLFDEDIDLAKPADGQNNSLKRAAFNAAAEKWGPDKAKWPKGLRMPFRDGNEKSSTGYEGTIFVNASSKTQPGLVDKNLRPILNETDFYAGCYARAEVIAYAYDKMGNKGIGFSLQNIQKLEDGEPFSGRKAASSVFDKVSDGSDDEDSYEDRDVRPSGEEGLDDLGF